MIDILAYEPYTIWRTTQHSFHREEVLFFGADFAKRVRTQSKRIFMPACEVNICDKNSLRNIAGQSSDKISFDLLDCPTWNLFNIISTNPEDKHMLPFRKSLRYYPSFRITIPSLFCNEL